LLRDGLKPPAPSTLTGKKQYGVVLDQLACLAAQTTAELDARYRFWKEIMRWWFYYVMEFRFFKLKKELSTDDVAILETEGIVFKLM
jgi:hypothetical protein